MPSTEDEWKIVADEYEKRWNFPNCIGSLDGKHIMIRQPVNSGSFYYNYKGTFSIVLLALVDADYRFIYVNVGCNGRISDGGVFRASSLSQALNEDLLGIPTPKAPCSYQTPLPFVIVADDAFLLQKNLMKPYPFRGLSTEKRIFNYRLSRARRIVENAFGILANRFRVFLSPIQLAPENVEKVVLASCALHNFLRDKSPLRYTQRGSLDNEMLEEGVVREGSWRTEHGEMQSIEILGSNNYTTDSKLIRDEFCNYFNTSGREPWQDKFVVVR